MPSYSEQVIMIAEIIERYVTERPRAADTPEGIHSWWVARQCHGDSLSDVQEALGYLVELGRLSRITLADGTVIYARATGRNEDGPK